mmetsp:Transcript_103271/g.321833  ORF Transcript_103271/g.321833 Transcript_103271/m.321833 type:complete len:225 (+) Transcript_103271:1221-1895(+)
MQPRGGPALRRADGGGAFLPGHPAARHRAQAHPLDAERRLARRGQGRRPRLRGPRRQRPAARGAPARGRRAPLRGRLHCARRFPPKGGGSGGRRRPGAGGGQLPVGHGRAGPAAAILRTPNGGLPPARAPRPAPRRVAAARRPRRRRAGAGAGLAFGALDALPRPPPHRRGLRAPDRLLAGLGRPPRPGGSRGRPAGHLRLRPGDRERRPPCGAGAAFQDVHRP